MAKKQSKNLIKQFGIEKDLRAGFNPEFMECEPKVAVRGVIYERTGAMVRFVEYKGTIVPVAIDIPHAMFPGHGDEWNTCASYASTAMVMMKTGDKSLAGAAVARGLSEACEIADGAFYRNGTDPVYEHDEAEPMKRFLAMNVGKLAKDKFGQGRYPDFSHTFGDREGLCIEYTCADSGEEAIAEVEEAYRAIVEDNEARDKMTKAGRKRASSARVQPTQQEVCLRAMAVHACEVEIEHAKSHLISTACLYKAMHGISHLDFADEFYQHFSRYALADRRKAERELKLARARLRTATNGYAKVIAAFGHDPYQKLAERALEILENDERLLGCGPIEQTRTKADMDNLTELQDSIIEGTISMQAALLKKFSNGEPMLTKAKFIEITRDESHVPA